MLTVTDYLAKYPDSRCGYSCALNVLGNNPLTNDFVVAPDNGYEDASYIDTWHNTCLKVSFVLPTVDYQPEFDERLTMVNLPTGDTMWIAEVVKHTDLSQEDPDPTEFDVTQVEHTVIDGAHTVGFPYCLSAGNSTEDYVFLVGTSYRKNWTELTIDGYKLVYKSDWLVNLSYSAGDNPRIQYAIFAKKELFK